MNHSFNRDIRYTFYRRCVNPIHTWKIDDDWIKEKNIEMDIILPFKNIDVLVNNAAIAIDTLVEDKNKDDFKKILDTNLIGPFILSRSVAKVMMKIKKVA